MPQLPLKAVFWQYLRSSLLTLRLHEFMPQVLSSFARNRLIDQVYLPLFGSNQKPQRPVPAAAAHRNQHPRGPRARSLALPEELNDYVAVLQRLLPVRDVIMKVNQEYIRSAAQAEEFRTEPAFKLQDSYRDMNKLAEKVHPVPNDQALHTLIATHYQNEAQTLTTGAEANLLKLRELLGWLTPVEAARWENIKSVFRKNKKYHGMDEGNQVTHMVVLVEAISEGWVGIKEALEVKKVGDVGLNYNIDNYEVFPHPNTYAPDLEFSMCSSAAIVI